jgi:hypothetical protein
MPTIGVFDFGFHIHEYKWRLNIYHALVEREALVRTFSPGSTLEPGLKAFRRRGPKCSL